MTDYLLQTSIPGIFQHNLLVYEPQKAFERYQELLENYPFKKEFKREDITFRIETIEGQCHRTISPEELERLALEGSKSSKI